MSYDNSYRKFHLTPSGWSTEAESTVPEDRVETWERIMTQRSVWSKEDVEWNLLWSSQEYTDEQRNQLRDSFPAPASGFRRILS